MWYIQLYDEFETANPLGSKKGVHELEGIYFTLRIFSPRFLEINGRVEIYLKLAKTPESKLFQYRFDCNNFKGLWYKLVMCIEILEPIAAKVTSLSSNWGY